VGPPSGRLSIQGQTVLVQAANLALIPLVGRIRRRNLERSHKNETRVNPYKRMTPPPTQNLKTLGLWVLYVAQLSHFYPM